MKVVALAVTDERLITGGDSIGASIAKVETGVLNPESTPNLFVLWRPSSSISPPISKTEVEDEDNEAAPPPPPPLEARLDWPLDCEGREKAGGIPSKEEDAKITGLA